MKIKLYFAFLTVIAFHPGTSHAQHGHLDAGARGKNQNDQLFFKNGADFVESSGYVKTLLFAESNRFAGYYEGNISLTSLPATADHAPNADPDAAALGSFLQFSMSCFSGPPGGSFGFWETNSTSPFLSLSPGESNSTLIRLTETSGLPGEDPYGHIHGRRFTATKAGLYKVGFTLWDTSTNGVGGGPIHAPSEVLPIYFQAGMNMVQIARTGLVSSIRYGATAGRLFTLEYTTNLADTNLWLPITAPTVGDDHFQTLEDPAAVDRYRFYRLRVDPFIP